MRKEESSFLKKRSKRLLFFPQLPTGWPWSGYFRVRSNKSLFASFSSEKEESLVGQMMRPSLGLMNFRHA
jgi:hypothetical protein